MLKDIALFAATFTVFAVVVAVAGIVGGVLGWFVLYVILGISASYAIPIGAVLAIGALLGAFE